MPGEIQRAIDRLNARKEAAGISVEAGRGTADSPVFSGLDLDPDEFEGAVDVAESVAQMLFDRDDGDTPAEVAAALWIDGIAMGLLIAEERAKP